jgi:hypothetical protein
MATMDASRRDYFRQAQVLRKQLGALLAGGLLATALMSLVSWRWLELLFVLVLLVCCGGIFVVSAWLFTRHHPALSLFNDRLWFRGFREQVVMLRNVDDAHVVESRVAGYTRRSIELTLRGAGADDASDAEHLRIPLDAVEADADELVELIRQRAAVQRERLPVR